MELFCDVSQTLEGKQYVTLENRILFSPEASSHRKNFKCYLMVLILTPRVYSLLVNEVDAIRVLEIVAKGRSKAGNGHVGHSSEVTSSTLCVKSLFHVTYFSIKFLQKVGKIYIE